MNARPVKFQKRDGSREDVFAQRAGYCLGQQRERVVFAVLHAKVL